MIGICASCVVIFSGVLIYVSLIFDDSYFGTLYKVLSVGKYSIIFFSCEAILLFIFSNLFRKKADIFLILALLVFDAAGNYVNWVHAESGIWNYEGNQGDAYEDESASVIKAIQEKDRGFYRIDKGFDSVYDKNGLPSDNDALVQKYFGLKSYCSVNNREYITFLQKMGIYVCVPLSRQRFIDEGILPEEIEGQDLNYINGVGADYDLMSYLGVKYYLSKEEFENVPDYFKQLEQYSTETIHVYENERYFPLAFVNEAEIGQDAFWQLQSEEKRMALMACTVVEAAGAEFDFDKNRFEKSIKEKQDAFRLISFQNDEVEFEIENSAEGENYLSFLIPYDKDWNVYIDGRKTETEKVNISLLGARIKNGTRHVKLVYRPALVYTGFQAGAVFILGIVITVILFRRKKYSFAAAVTLINEKTERLKMPVISEKVQKQVKKAAVLAGSIAVLTMFQVYTRANQLKIKELESSMHKSVWNEYVVRDVKADALDIDIEDPLAERNEPHRVICTVTENLPADCDLGVEYVHFYDNHNITLQIVGRDSSRIPKMWLRQYTEINGWSEYVCMDSVGQCTDLGQAALH